ncbi:TPA: hypothetical protein EYO12_01445 [Candidatus Saccharibacteria bacterium]|nr:hypothetical protein [Candidatus Saccharibacteria bacterium]HIO87380.1 hypothetical protein [Candidatus Saccharibacteria bacterium]
MDAKELTNACEELGQRVGRNRELEDYYKSDEFAEVQHALTSLSDEEAPMIEYLSRLIERLPTEEIQEDGNVSQVATHLIPVLSSNEATGYLRVSLVNDADEEYFQITAFAGIPALKNPLGKGYFSGEDTETMSTINDEVVYAKQVEFGDFGSETVSKSPASVGDFAAKYCDYDPHRPITTAIVKDVQDNIDIRKEFLAEAAQSVDLIKQSLEDIS